MKTFTIYILFASMALFLVACAETDRNPRMVINAQPASSLMQELDKGNLSQEGQKERDKISLRVSKADPWPLTPPKIGRLELKPEYWHYMKEAARKYKVSPYLIQAVAAIESRYDPKASSGRGQCYGLMQLHRETARKYGVNPRDPRENIMGGAAVLAKLLAKHNGDLRRVLRVYNATSTAAYEREVFKAFAQAMSSGQAANQVAIRGN